MKLKTITSVFAILLFMCVAAQTERINLQWYNIKQHIIQEKDTLHCLYFDGAIYDFDKACLPVYFKRFKAEKQDNILKVELINTIFEEISPAEAALLKNIHLISHHIDIKTYISVYEKQPFYNIKFIPIKKNALTGNYEKLVSFTLSYQFIEENRTINNKKSISWADNSVLKTGKWYKIAVNKNGIFKLTYEQLTSMGINITDPRKIRIYGNGGGMLPEVAGEFVYDDLVENAIYVSGENDGSFDPGDYVLFYGESPHNWFYYNNQIVHSYNLYSNYNYYFVNADIGNGKRISPQSSSVALPNKTVTDFIDYAFHEIDTVNFLVSGKNWFGERFEVVTNYNFLFSFPNVKTNDTAILKTNVLAHSYSDSDFNFTCGNKTKKINIPGIGNDIYLFGHSITDTLKFLPNSSNLNVNVVYNKPSSSSSGYLDFIEIIVRRHLIYSGGQFIFRDDKSVGPGNISDFIVSNASSNLILWEITNPHDIKKQDYIINGDNMTFRLPTDSTREFVIFDGSLFYTPSLIGSVENQNLHSLSKISFVIVTPTVFLDEANRLADFHRSNDNITVAVVTTEQVYNEFSSGKQDVAAIRNLMKMLYDKSTAPEYMPKNILLFGDASYDYKNRIPNNTNFVPTFESIYSLSAASSWATDDFFGILDNNEGYNSNGDMDIGVGRLVYRSLEEAKNGVDKILRYGSKTNLVPSGNTISNMADWRNILCFIADDGENGDGVQFMFETELITTIMESKYKKFNVDKIYLDAFQQIITPGGPRYPDVNQAINKRVLKGALIINYVGHSGELGWSLERVLGLSDINSWNNKYNMPVFFSASCSFSRYDDPAITSAGEQILLNSNSGGIALYSTTRLAYSGPNNTLNINVFDTAFSKVNGNYYSMGEIMKIARVRSGSNESIRNFILLGDPALKMANPKYQIITTMINNDSVYSTIDTIKALSMFTVHGYIADDAGNKLTDFNGKIYPTVYDKFSTVKTLGNDPPSPPYEFKIRKNILYKGKASVKNGDFTFKFIVPKDINYTFGKGKISYYAENGNSDAAGYYDNFIIGGSETNYPVDNQGPDISLYLNDLNFISGGITDENPSIFSILFDESGINTVGNGVGHDIIAILDDNNQNPYILNDYYQSDLDSYQKGSILYPLLNLSEGVHKLKLRAWDIYNNSSDATTEFIVSKSALIALKNILNYPNPFTEKTYFRFEHNQPDVSLDVVIQIFSINGNLVKTIEQKIFTAGYIADQIVWDGRNDYGQPIGAGIYIYKVKIGNKESGYTEKSQKLVIIK